GSATTGGTSANGGSGAANGQTPSNEWINGKWYNADGSQSYEPQLQWKSNATGWWVEDTNGWYPTSQWQKIDGYWYYFKSNGYMASGEWCSGYYFNSDGSWTYEATLSWKSDATGWWVEDSYGWYPANQWAKIDDTWYYFLGNGYMATDQYVDGYWLGSDGACW
ncbi:MAG: hypothetical protein K6E10_11825, partial [Eubacterium sp.]|nr:hypothetical protein [Eubacterium sp.]